ncbi:MAG TPA: hypothetical protein VI456_11190 [Polyangia bacterium]
MGAPAQEPRFKTPEQVAVARLALDAIQKVARDPKLAPGPPTTPSPKT